MGNPEHLEILKRGAGVWNKWREKNPNLTPDLRNSELHGADFSGVVLRGIDLSKSLLNGINIFLMDLCEADLHKSHLSGANLRNVQLRRSNLIEVDLSLSNIFLSDISNSDLSMANLIGTIFREVHLDLAIFTQAKIGLSTFGNVNLSTTKGLEDVIHEQPSTIGIDTLFGSKGKIHKAFLRGAGVPENLIEYVSTLTDKSFDYYSCFISYSSIDQGFAERLYTELQTQAVRCWFAPEDMKIGDKIRSEVDRSIRIHDKLLLVLSENSLSSGWVEDECVAAFEEERRRKTNVLFPVRIDDAVMDTENAWAAKLRRSRHIGDFTKWKDHIEYQKAFDRLLRNLKAEG